MKSTRKETRKMTRYTIIADVPRTYDGERTTIMAPDDETACRMLSILLNPRYQSFTVSMRFGCDQSTVEYARQNGCRMAVIDYREVASNKATVSAEDYYTLYAFVGPTHPDIATRFVARDDRHARHVFRAMMESTQRADIVADLFGFKNPETVKLARQYGGTIENATGYRIGMIDPLSGERF